MKEIAETLGISTCAVGRVVKKAICRGDLVRRPPAKSVKSYVGMDMGSLHRAFDPHDQAFLSWVRAQSNRTQVTVAELAVSALLDVYYEELE